MADLHKGLTIEWLFPDSHQYFGERGSKMLLDRTLPDARSILTPLTGRPYFAGHDDVDLVMLGPSVLSYQAKALEKLRPYADRLSILIDRGTHFWVTGNSLELFGRSIDDVDGTRLEGLGLFDFVTKRDRHSRLSCFVLASAGSEIITAYKAQSSEIFAGHTTPFVQIQRGFGDNREAETEGVHRNNFFGTGLLGPLLVLNPLFTKKWLAGLTGGPVTLPFEENLILAWKRRLADFENPRIVRNV